MESKRKLKEIDIENHTCYFFYDDNNETLSYQF